MTTPLPNPAFALIVFSDLDGTLLDHHSYTFAPARPALDKLDELNVPLVIVTSKTLAEVRALREKLGNQAPFITENGSVAVIPESMFTEAQTEGWVHESFNDNRLKRFSPDYNILRSLFVEWRDQHALRMEGFGDWSAEQVAEKTGLSVEEARLAKERDGSEPFEWYGSDDEFQQLSALIGENGLNCVRGGRFYHLLGQTDKALAAGEVLDVLGAQFTEAPQTVALGDSPNDLPLLAMADFAVVIKKHDGSHMTFENGERVLFTQGQGPSGWNEAIVKILQQLENGNV